MAVSPATDSEFMDQRFVGQQFVYKPQDSDTNSDHEHKEDIDSFRCDASLLAHGYVKQMERNCDFEHSWRQIPNEVIELILYFYGKKYVIHGPPPPSDEYFDYAVEILSNIEMLGITHNHQYICSCTSQFAKKNIVVGSEILQMNHDFITEKVHKNDWRVMSEMFKTLKQTAPSCIVFRCKLAYIRKGTHFQMNVCFDAQHHDQETRFPYHKCTQTAIQQILSTAFADDTVDLYQIYAFKHKLGVAILFFVRHGHEQEEEKEQKLSYSRQELQHLENELQSAFRRETHEQCTVKFEQQMYGRRGNRLDRGFSAACSEESFIGDKLTLMSLIYTVKGVDDGKAAWYLVLCEPGKLDAFLKELSAPIIHLEQFGNIIFSAYGDDIDKAAEKSCFDAYEYS